jgi:GT2 family glycosyltransferase
MYSEEVDWCRRFWAAGWEVWHIPDADVVHVGSASSQNDMRRRLALYKSRLGFRRKVARADFALLKALLQVDPLARWAVS